MVPTVFDTDTTGRLVKRAGSFGSPAQPLFQPPADTSDVLAPYFLAFEHKLELTEGLGMTYRYQASGSGQFYDWLEGYVQNGELQGIVQPDSYFFPPVDTVTTPIDTVPVDSAATSGLAFRLRSNPIAGPALTLVADRGLAEPVVGWLTSAQGQLIRRFEIPENTKAYDLHAGTLARGAYFIVLQMNGERQVLRVLRQ